MNVCKEYNVHDRKQHFVDKSLHLSQQWQIGVIVDKSSQQTHQISKFPNTFELLVSFKHSVPYPPPPRKFTT